MAELDVADLTRLRLEPGEVLLVRIPRDMSMEATSRMLDILRDLKHENDLPWPILVSRDDVEFLALDGRRLVEKHPFSSWDGPND